MSETKSYNRGGVGISTVLLVVFVVLKLTDNIAWSWLWVLSPLWGSIALWVVLMVLMLVVTAVSDTRERRRWRKRSATRKGGGL